MPPSGAGPTLAMEDVDWTNVQDPVRLAFQQVLQLLRKQQGDLRQLTLELGREREARERLAQQVSELSATVAGAAARDELEAAAARATDEARLALRDGYDEMLRGAKAAAEAHAERLWQRSEAVVEDLRAALLGKAERQELGARGEIATRSDVDALRSALERKLDAEAFALALPSLVTAEKLADALSRKADASHVYDLLSAKLDHSEARRIEAALRGMLPRAEARDLVDTEIHRALFGLGRVGPLDAPAASAAAASAAAAAAAAPAAGPPSGALVAEAGGGAASPGMGVPHEVPLRPMAAFEVEELVERRVADSLARRDLDAELRLERSLERLASSQRAQRDDASRLVDQSASALKAALTGDLEAAAARLRSEQRGSADALRDEIGAVRAALSAQSREVVAALNKKAWQSDLQRVAESRASKKDLALALEGLAPKPAAPGAAPAGKKAGGPRAADLRKLIAASEASLLRRARELCRSEASRQAEEWRREAAERSSGLEEKLEALRSHTRRELAARVRREELREEVERARGARDAARREVRAEIQSALGGKGEGSKRAEAVERRVAALQRRARAELEAGRWLWRSGDRAGDLTVPWEVEVCNAQPSELVWQRGCRAICCRRPGLYEVSAAVFTDRSVRLELVVDGESAVVVAAREDDAGGRRRPPHTAGEVTSCAMREFVALPPDANVGLRVLCAPEVRAQGFLALRKL